MKEHPIPTYMKYTHAEHSFETGAKSISQNLEKDMFLAVVARECPPTTQALVSLEFSNSLAIVVAPGTLTKNDSTQKARNFEHYAKTCQHGNQMQTQTQEFGPMHLHKSTKARNRNGNYQQAPNEKSQCSHDKLLKRTGRQGLFEIDSSNTNTSRTCNKRGKNKQHSQ